MFGAGEERAARLAMAGMALLVFTASVVLHEGLGHGGACVALGATPFAWGAFYFDCISSDPVVNRLVSAAGAGVNVVAALLALAALGRARTTSIRLLVWLFGTVNWLQATGYLAFSGLTELGDWGIDGVLRDVANLWPWRALETLLGAGLYYGGAVFAARRLEAIVGGTPERLALARKLSWTAYFTGGGFALLVGLLNPIGIVIVLISAVASTFGGASGLMWLTQRMPRQGGEPALDPIKPAPWLIAGVVVAVLFAATLGRSLNLR